MNSDARQERFVVAIAGGSGSGKTTFARKMIEASRKLGVEGRLFSLDNYYKPLRHVPFEKRKAFNFDHPDAIDFALAVSHLKTLLGGKPVRQPVYNFAAHTRSAETRLLRPAPLLVVEGLYALYPPKLTALCDYRIFVSTGIATAVLRRVSRDVRERGRTIQDAKHQILSTVLPMYEDFVKPTQRNAHFSINWEGEEIPEKAAEGLGRMLRDHFR